MGFLDIFFRKKPEMKLRENPDIIINLCNNNGHALYLCNPEDSFDQFTNSEIEDDRRIYKCYARDIDQTLDDKEQDDILAKDHNVIVPRDYDVVLGKGEWSKYRTMIFLLPNDITKLPETFQSGKKSLLFAPYIIRKKAEIDVVEAMREGDKQRLLTLKKTQSIFGEQLKAWYDRQIEDFNKYLESKSPQMVT